MLSFLPPLEEAEGGGEGGVVMESLSLRFVFAIAVKHIPGNIYEVLRIGLAFLAVLLNVVAFCTRMGLIVCVCDQNTPTRDSHPTTYAQTYYFQYS